MQAVFNVVEKPVSAIKQAETGVTSEQKADAFASELERVKATNNAPANAIGDKPAKSANHPTTEAEEIASTDGKNLPTTTESDAESQSDQVNPDEKSAPLLTDNSGDNVEKEKVDAALTVVVADTDQAEKNATSAVTLPLATIEQTHKQGSSATASPLTEMPRLTKAMTIRADLADALNPHTKLAVEGEKAEPTLRNQLAATLNQTQPDNATQKSLINLNNEMLERPLTSSATSIVFSPSSNSQTALTAATPMANAQPVLTVQPHLNQSAWGQVMSSRVMWMASEGVQQAEIRLNPAQMGPVEVRLQLHHDQASITFLAQQGATREALEQALPRLRDSFAEAGLQLAHANVGEHAPQQQHAQSEQKQNTTFFTQANPITVDTESETEQRPHSATDSVGLSLYA